MVRCSDWVELVNIDKSITKHEQSVVKVEQNIIKTE